jgi:hypothetical protein
MRALVAAGAREEIGDQDERNQPDEHQHLDQARRAAHGHIDRQGGEGDQAAEQPGRHEGAMARRHERVALRRRRRQTVDMVPSRRGLTHGPCARPMQRRAPLISGGIVSEAA